MTRLASNRPQSISGITRSITARTRPSAAPRVLPRGDLPARFGSLAFMAEVEDRQRRQRYANRMIPPVRRYRTGLRAAVVAHAAAAVVGRVRVQDLAPVAPVRYADQVILARDRGEVADDEHRAVAVARLADEGQRAVLGIAAVDPLEACVLEVDLVQRAFAGVDAIQIGHPVHDAAVLRVLEHPPLQALLVLPFAALRELPAHEKELLARMRPHVAVQQ